MFEDRTEAGELLLEKLSEFRKDKEALVLGITRGGVVVADRIARKLKLPLDIIVIKKIGAPFNPELAIGAVGPGRSVYWEKRLLREVNVTSKYKKIALGDKRLERRSLERYLRGGRRAKAVKDKTVILVDDGVATGATVLGALSYLRSQKAKEVVLATPVIAKDTYNNIVKYFDSIVGVLIPDNLNAVGQFYQEFGQIENDEVKDIIKRQKK